MAYRAPMVFNNATGSDSTASGIGQDPAINGSAAYCSGFGTTTIDLSYDSPNLSSVQAGDCIYVPYLNIYGERSFLEIVSVNPLSYTVTVSTGINSSFSFTNWAIGGKRAFGNTAEGRLPFDSLNTQGVFNSQYEIEYTGFDYTHSAGVTLYENASIVGTGSQMPKIVMTSNGQVMFNSYTAVITNSVGLIANLWITNNGTATGTICIDWNDESLIVNHCKLGHNTATPVQNGISMAGTKAGLTVNATEFYSSNYGVIGSIGSTSMLTCCNCSFEAPTSGGIYFNNGSGVGNVINCTFTNSSVGINFNQSDRFFVAGNIFNNISGNAFFVNFGETGGCVGNVFNDCQTGANASGTVSNSSRLHRNYFNGNVNDTSGEWETNKMHNTDYDIALGGDPFVSSTDTTLAGNTASDILIAQTAADANTFELSELRPFGFANIASGGGGGSNVFVIEE